MLSRVARLLVCAVLGLSAWVWPWAVLAVGQPMRAIGSFEAQHPGYQLKGVSAVVVLFSMPECRYCEIVRRQALRHIENEPAYRSKVKVFEVDQADTSRSLVWFDGQRISGKMLAEKLNVRFSPTVMVFTAKGQPVGQPLLGISIPDFYSQYLNALVDDALSQQKQ